MYKRQEYGFLGEPGKLVFEDYLQEQNGRLAIAWSPIGHGAVTYFLQSLPNGGFSFVPQWGSSSDADEARFIAKLIGGAVLGAGVLDIATVIGNAVMGAELAVAYPTIANVIGQVAITTAYNGGDIESAVKSALLSQAGGAAGAVVGGAVFSLTEIETIAKLASTATRTVIAGGDLKTAAAVSLLKSGASYSPPANQTGEKMGFEFDFNFGDNLAQQDGADFEMIQPIQPSYDIGNDFMPVVSYAAEDFPSTFGPTDYSIPYLAPIDIPNIEIAEPPIIPVSDSIAETPWNAKETINTISDAALKAITIYSAIKKINNPTVNPVSRNVTVGGALVSALDTGVVQTRGPDGKISNQRPPVNVAQSTVTGNVVINNGDGTYSLIDPSGNKRIIKYGEGSGSLLTDIPWGVIAAGVGVIGLVMRIGKK